MSRYTRYFGPLRRRKMVIIDAIKAARGCADCGFNNPVALDFDHVRGEKLFEVADKVSWFSLDKLLDEIEKCDIVCANCHRIRTEDRRLPGG